MTTTTNSSSSHPPLPEWEVIVRRVTGSGTFECGQAMYVIGDSERATEFQAQLLEFEKDPYMSDAARLKYIRRAIEEISGQIRPKSSSSVAVTDSHDSDADDDGDDALNDQLRASSSSNPSLPSSSPAMTITFPSSLRWWERERQWRRIIRRVLTSYDERGDAWYVFGHSPEAATLRKQLFKYEKDPNMTDEKRRELIRQANVAAVGQLQPESPPSVTVADSSHEPDEAGLDDQLNVSSSSNGSIKSQIQSAATTTPSKPPANTLRRRRRTETTD